jgi:microcystin-dependent protein
MTDGIDDAGKPHPDRRQVVGGAAAGTVAWLMSLGETRAQAAGDGFLGMIMPVAFNFPPKGWALCNGQLLPINQNQALFSLLGTMYGGDGRVNFALPDLRGRTPTGFSNSFPQGTRYGEEFHTLNQGEMPAHNHLVNVAEAAPTGRARVPPANAVFTPSNIPAATMFGGFTSPVPLAAGQLTNTGGSQPHNNMQPFLVVNFIVALQGIFPSRN